MYEKEKASQGTSMAISETTITNVRVQGSVLKKWNLVWVNYVVFTLHLQEAERHLRWSTLLPSFASFPLWSQANAVTQDLQSFFFKEEPLSYSFSIRLPEITHHIPSATLLRSLHPQASIHLPSSTRSARAVAFQAAFQNLVQMGASQEANNAQWSSVTRERELGLIWAVVGCIPGGVHLQWGLLYFLSRSRA